LGAFISLPWLRTALSPSPADPGNLAQRSSGRPGASPDLTDVTVPIRERHILIWIKGHDPADR